MKTRTMWGLVTAMIVIEGCCYLPPPPSESSGAAPQPSTAAAPEAPGVAAFESLESHLREGHHHGEGPGAQELAAAIRTGLEPRDAAAVRVTPIADGTRRIVVLVRFDDDATEGLASLDEAARQEYLEALLDIVDDQLGAAGDRVGIGIRGNFFYGAIVTRRPGAPPEFSIGTSVDTAPLAELAVASP